MPTPVKSAASSGSLAPSSPQQASAASRFAAAAAPSSSATSAPDSGSSGSDDVEVTLGDDGGDLVTTPTRPTKQADASSDDGSTPVETPAKPAKPAKQQDIVDPGKPSFELHEQVTKPVAEQVKSKTGKEFQGTRTYPEDPDLTDILSELPNHKYAKWLAELPKWKQASTKAVELEKQVAELSKGPRYFYEHEGAYTLTDEYRQLQDTISYDEFEEQHWSAQLEAIKRGEPWFNLKGYKQNGEPIFEQIGAPEDGKSDSRAEIAVQKALQQAALNRRDNSKRLDQLGLSWKQKVAGAKQELSAIEQRLFPTLADESKWTPQDKEYGKIAENIVPEIFSGHPLARQLKLAFVSYMRLLSQYRDAVTQLERTRGVTNARQMAGPGNGDLAANQFPSGDDDDEVINIKKEFPD